MRVDCVERRDELDVRCLIDRPEALRSRGELATGSAGGAGEGAGSVIVSLIGFESLRIEAIGDGEPVFGKGKLVCRPASFRALGIPLPEVDPVRTGLRCITSGTLPEDP